MIDFERIKDIVPRDGSLVLIFRQDQKGELEVYVAPKYKGKENEPALAPFRIHGDAATMAAQFEEYVTNVTPLERDVAEAKNPVAARKQNLEKKTGGTATKAPEKKEEAKKPADHQREAKASGAKKEKTAGLEGTFFEKKPRPAKEPEDETSGPNSETKQGESETETAESETKPVETEESWDCETCNKPHPGGCQACSGSQAAAASEDTGSGEGKDNGPEGEEEEENA